MHAEIAGAGFAGLAAAIALRQRGWTVRVHEKEAALRAFGAGIFVWENGLRVLHAIGAYDDVVRGAPQPSAYESRRDGVCVTLEKVNGPNPFRLLTMTRQHLYAGILAAAQREGVEILTRSEAVGARPEGVLQLADGRSLPADLVIAADGVRSALRDSLGLVGTRRKYQDGLIRVLLEERTDLVGEPWNRVINSWVLNPRTLRILYAPCEEGRRYIGLMAPVDAKDASTLPIDPAVWEPCFPEFASALRLIGSRGRHDVYETTRLDVVVRRPCRHRRRCRPRHAAAAGPRRLLRHDERVEPGAVRVGRIRDRRAHCSGGRRRSAISPITPKRARRSLPARARSAAACNGTTSGCVPRCTSPPAPGRRIMRGCGARSWELLPTQARGFRQNRE